MPRLSVGELATEIAAVLAANGLKGHAARAVAASIVAAQRDGAESHGLLRLPGYVSTLRSGWVDGKAEPLRSADSGRGVVAVDARNGFAQPALETIRSELMERADSVGVATALIRNSHHFAALWPDVEEFAVRGFIAMSAVNCRPAMVLWGGTRPVIGTNAMAFACPTGSAFPIVWDQASSVLSQGELMLAQEQSRPVPLGVGVDARGQPTVSAGEILQGGSLLPFGGAKGGAIAFMVEILAAACTGADFGFENDLSGVQGAATSRGGQFILLIRPPSHEVTGSTFALRVGRLVEIIRAAGAERLPSERRYRRRAESLASGILISDAQARMLRELQSR